MILSDDFEVFMFVPASNIDAFAPLILSADVTRHTFQGLARA